VEKVASIGGAPSRTAGLGVVFGLPGSLSIFLGLHVGLKVVVCEVGMGINLGERCFKFHGYL
jgi:hypothetical protein